MPQTDAWEKEYRNPKLVTGKPEPQNDVKRYLKFYNSSLSTMTPIVLDLGCGTGRNANFLAERGFKVTGFEISSTALKTAKKRAQEASLFVDYHLHNIGAPFPADICPDASFDLLLDVTSSNSLNEKERAIYLDETYRVLKSGGHFFVRALCKEGDTNVKELLKRDPGLEQDTYINKEMGLIERVFSREDFLKTYARFETLKLEKKTGYARFNGRIYKRNYWLAYLKKV